MSDLLAAGDVVVQIADPNHSSIVLTAWGTVAAAVAAGATFIVAMSIGRQASKIADSQRAIAGMNILRDTYNDLFCSPIGGQCDATSSTHG